MEGITQGMISMARGLNKTLTNDNLILDEVNDTADKNVATVKAQTKKGRDLLWSGQLSWITTMIMLAVSVVIFFSMIPFIIFT
mmetsp:Transcript_58512/g.106971  ORF Transcript_58512/g.106971 Transcript_58512/m.106971 type:complete len:83 (+) Transcript_58512:2-250(+)